VISACGQDVPRSDLLLATHEINQAPVAVEHIRQPRVIPPSWPTLSSTPDIPSSPSSLRAILSFFSAFNPFHSPKERGEDEPHRCGSETTTILPWQVKNFTFDALGNPKPLEFTLSGDSTTAHKLSVVDLDRKDVRMGVYVDDVLFGLTTAMEPDPKQDCGHDLPLCLQMQFSAGVAHILTGIHAVRIEPLRQGDCDDCE